MKIVNYFFTSAVIVIVDTIATRSEVNLSKLENKILHGIPAEENEQKYLASLQLIETHICSAGLFQDAFLLTTAICAHHIGKHVEQHQQRATVVIGDLSLKNGQRIDIWKIAYHNTFKTYDHEVGVIMLPKKSMQAKALHLHGGLINLRKDGHFATVCGWGTESGETPDVIGYGEYVETLSCMHLILYSKMLCIDNVPYGDYQRKLICGKSEVSKHMVTLGDVGSPLTKFINLNGTITNCIVGVTIYPFKNENDTMLRFARVSGAFQSIQSIVETLENPNAANLDHARSSQDDLQDKCIKRSKIH